MKHILFLRPGRDVLEHFHITTLKHAWSTTMGTGTVKPPGSESTGRRGEVIDLTEQQQVMFTDVDKERKELVSRVREFPAQECWLGELF